MAKSSALKSLDHDLKWPWSVLVLLALIALPFVANVFGEAFYIALATRILIFALAATSLNLILGFGGMVSFGHAAFLGVGAYTVVILSQMGVVDAWVAWPTAMVVAGLFALLIGAVSLRTQGVYFIMITLAFAQMMYYLVVSFKAYGGDDGMSLPARSRIGFLDMSNDTHFYYVTLLACVAVLVLIARVLNARFGHVLQAIRENEVRMQSLGYAVFRYKLCAFVMSGAMAGLAGALLANQSGFVSPAMMQWSQSGMLMMMVILGGVGHLYGGDEGLNIKSRSNFGMGLDLKNDLTFYFVVLLVLVLTLVIISRMMKSRFGRVILAIRDDDTRVDAIGFPAYTYKWVLFIIAGTLGGLAGALMVNHQNYVSPNLMHWTQSGTLMIMVILGGVGTLSGGLWGALVLLILEDVIAEYTVYWQFYIGWFLLAVVLLAPRGLSSVFNRPKKLETKGHA